MKTIPVAHTSKGHRVWLQGVANTFAGWHVGARFNVTFETGQVVLQQGDDGKRKVVAGKGGVIDTTSKKVSVAMAGCDTARVAVDADKGRIIIAGVPS